MDHLCLFLRQIVMGGTHFHGTLNEFEHHFSNIEQTPTCSSNSDQTQKPYFWLRTNGHRTSNLKGLH